MVPTRNLLLVVSALATIAAVPIDGGVFFRPEGAPVIDDVFGDTADYRRMVDRFVELTAAMQATRDQFARSAQQILATINRSGPKERKNKRERCETVATPYARALRLGAEYLLAGRELGRHYEQIREFDRLGESLGLTPDYRAKVKRVVRDYTALLVDYREMKFALHDQLNDELKFAGCDLPTLALKGDPQHRASAAAATADWPAPGEPGAPGGQTEKTENNETSETAGKPPALEPAKTEVVFFVDNTRCKRASSVFLDGKRIGAVPAATRSGFEATLGPHELCVLDDEKITCGAPGTIRHSYLHEGWTIALRCQ